MCGTHACLFHAGDDGTPGALSDSLAGVFARLREAEAEKAELASVNEELAAEVRACVLVFLCACAHSCGLVGAHMRVAYMCVLRTCARAFVMCEQAELASMNNV